MGSEVIVVFIPLGALLFAFVLYMAACGPERIYPVAALVMSVVAAGYIASQSGSGYVVWFFIWFAFVSVPIGAVAHLARWLIQRIHTAKAEK